MKTKQELDELVKVFRRQHEDNPRYTLKAFCRDNNTDYADFRYYLRALGVPYKTHVNRKHLSLVLDEPTLVLIDKTKPANVSRSEYIRRLLDEALEAAHGSKPKKQD